jgi:hypothetical protein
LGNENKEHWKQYDACELLKAYNGKSLDILVDVVSCRVTHSCILSISISDLRAELVFFFSGRAPEIIS